jgi:hypothetical protein
MEQSVEDESFSGPNRHRGEKQVSLPCVAGGNQAVAGTGAPRLLRAR